jgi:hypothetical protein
VAGSIFQIQISFWKLSRGQRYSCVKRMSLHCDRGQWSDTVCYIESTVDIIGLATYHEKTALEAGIMYDYIQ